MTAPEKVTRKLQDLAPGALLELFEVLVGDMPGHAGEEPLRLHAGTNELSENVVFGGVTYARWPIEAEGFESSTQGVAPRPVLRVANASHQEFGVFSELLRQYSDLIKARVRRILVYAEFIDAVNFAAGNPLADPDAVTSIETWYVEQKTKDTPTVIELTLSNVLDLEGVMVPARQVLGATCPFCAEYRSGNGCDYAGTNYFDRQDNPVTDPALDACSGTLKACVLRHTTPVSWQKTTSRDYAGALAAMRAESVLPNPTLAGVSETNLWPSNWGVYRPDKSVTVRRAGEKVVYIDICWEAARVDGTQEAFLILHKDGYARADVPTGKTMALWLQVAAGSILNGSWLSNAGYSASLELGWLCTSSSEPTAKHLISCVSMSAAALGSFDLHTGPVGAIPETFDFTDGDHNTYAVPVTHCYPVVWHKQTLLNLEPEDPRTVSFTLRVGQPAISDRTDYSAFLGGKSVTVWGPVTAPLPFGGFVGASLMARS